MCREKYGWLLLLFNVSMAANLGEFGRREFGGLCKSAENRVLCVFLRILQENRIVRHRKYILG